jgi:hypothetical protein
MYLYLSPARLEERARGWFEIGRTLYLDKGMFRMKIFIFAFGLAAMASASSAESDYPTAQEINSQVIKAVKSYAHATACEAPAKESEYLVAPLVPYKNFTDKFRAKYAVLWDGDLGCTGGNVSHSTQISMVVAGVRGHFVVDPLQSSPVVQFEHPGRGIQKILGHTPDALILEGRDYGPEDRICCPTIPVQIIMQRDLEGDWKAVETKALPSK